MARKAGKSGIATNYTIRFSPEEKKWLEATAKKEFRPVAGLVRYIIAQYRKEQEERT